MSARKQGRRRRNAAPELNEVRRRCRLIEKALKETLGEPLDRTLY